MVLDTKQMTDYIVSLQAERDKIEAEAKKRIDASNQLISAKTEELKHHVLNSGCVDDSVQAFRILIGLDEGDILETLDYVLGANDHRGELFLFVRVQCDESDWQRMADDYDVYSSNITVDVVLGEIPCEGLNIDFFRKAVMFPQSTIFAGNTDFLLCNIFLMDTSSIGIDKSFVTDLHRVNVGGDLIFDIARGEYKKCAKRQSRAEEGISIVLPPSFFVYGDEIVEKIFEEARGSYSLASNSFFRARQRLEKKLVVS